MGRIFEQFVTACIWDQAMTIRMLSQNMYLLPTVAGIARLQGFTSFGHQPGWVQPLSAHPSIQQAWNWHYITINSQTATGDALTELSTAPVGNLAVAGDWKQTKVVLVHVNGLPSEMSDKCSQIGHRFWKETKSFMVAERVLHHRYVYRAVKSLKSSDQKWQWSSDSLINSRASVVPKATQETNCDQSYLHCPAESISQHLSGAQQLCMYFITVACLGRQSCILLVNARQHVQWYICTKPVPQLRVGYWQNQDATRFHINHNHWIIM